MMDSLRTLRFMRQHHLNHALLVGLFSWGAVLLGVVPDVSVSNASGFNTVVLAQQSPEFSEAEIRNYARAVLGIEPRRRPPITKFKRYSGRENQFPMWFAVKPELLMAWIKAFEILR